MVLFSVVCRVLLFGFFQFQMVTSCMTFVVVLNGKFWFHILVPFHADISVYQYKVLQCLLFI